MFWNKKKIQKHSSPGQDTLFAARMTVIPDIFYGGADPTIFPAKTPSKRRESFPVPSFGQTAAPAAPERSTETVITSAPSARADESSAQKDALVQPALSKLRKRWLRLAAVGGLFLICLGGISWYYIYEARTPARPPDNNRPPSSLLPTPGTPSAPGVTAPPISPPSPSATSTSTVVTSTLTSTPDASDGALSLPRFFSPDSVDLDRDGLTDAEEELFGTDSGVWDTDADGYHDGREVVNLYNPRGQAPIRLVDSGLVREYVGSGQRYRIYYPNAWEAANVDASGIHTIFTAITGDFVEVRVFEKPAAQSFQDWFAVYAANEQFSDLQPFVNRFQLSGMRRKDGLVYYFSGEREVVTLVYHLGTGDTVGYRRTMEAMAQSLRFGSSAPELPSQPVLVPVSTNTLSAESIPSSSPTATLP